MCSFTHVDSQEDIRTLSSSAVLPVLSWSTVLQWYATSIDCCTIHVILPTLSSYVQACLPFSLHNVTDSRLCVRLPQMCIMTITSCDFRLLKASSPADTCVIFSMLPVSYTCICVCCFAERSIAGPTAVILAPRLSLVCHFLISAPLAAMLPSFPPTPKKTHPDTPGPDSILTSTALRPFLQPYCLPPPPTPESASHLGSTFSPADATCLRPSPTSTSIPHPCYS